MLREKFIRSVSLSMAFVLGICPAFPADVLASGLSDLAASFSFSYTSSISQASVYPGGSLSPTITGVATCNTDLTFTVSAATISGRVVAQGPNNQRVVLNPGYSVSIGSFPTQKGQSVQESQTIALSFPDSMPLGQYNLVGEVITARVQVVLWFDVTSYVPSSMSLGTVTIIEPPAPDPVPEPSPDPPPTTSTAPPTATTPPPTSTVPPTTSTASPPTTTILPPPTSAAQPTTSTISPTTIAPPPSTAIPTASSPQPSPVPPTSPQVVITQPPGVLATSSAPESPLPMIQTTGQPTSSANRVSANAGIESWVLFPVSVGALTFLLVVLAVIRTPRAPLRKEEYKLELPPEN